MAYSCYLDDDVAEIIKQKAKEQDRSVRGQIIFYLKSALQNDSKCNTNEKADPIRQDKKSAFETTI